MAGYVFAFFWTEDKEAHEHASRVLIEGRTYEISKQWSVRVDRSHVNVAMTHNHVRLKGRDVAVMNRDGSASHSSDLNQIPNWVRDEMKKMGLVESMMLVESIDDPVPKEVIDYAIYHEELVDRAGIILSKTG